MTNLCVFYKVHCFRIDFFCRLITLLTWVSDMFILAVEKQKTVWKASG